MPNVNIQDYDDLVSNVAKYIKRTDLAVMIPVFIQFAEDYFDKCEELFNVVPRRRSFQVTPTQTVFPGPTDMKAPIQAYMGGQLIDFFPISWDSSYANGNIPQIGRGYQILGNNISLSVPQLGQVFQLDYYQILEGLSETNESNWLLEDSPLIYLSGVLHEAFSYTRDAEKAQYWMAKRDSQIATYSDDEKRSQYPAGPLTIRAG
jgi:hypothetical protein